MIYLFSLLAWWQYHICLINQGKKRDGSIPRYSRTDWFMQGFFFLSQPCPRQARPRPAWQVRCLSWSSTLAAVLYYYCPIVKPMYRPIFAVRGCRWRLFTFVATAFVPLPLILFDSLTYLRSGVLELDFSAFWGGIQTRLWSIGTTALHEWYKYCVY